MNKTNHTKNSLTNTLIGEKEHRDFICFQSEYGVALRGGSLSRYTDAHSKRISSNINLLNTKEKRQLIFPTTLLTN